MYVKTQHPSSGVAELVDARVLGTCASDGVGVRLPSPRGSCACILLSELET